MQKAKADSRYRIEANGCIGSWPNRIDGAPILLRPASTNVGSQKGFDPTDSSSLIVQLQEPKTTACESEKRGR